MGRTGGGGSRGGGFSHSSHSSSSRSHSSHHSGSSFRSSPSSSSRISSSSRPSSGGSFRPSSGGFRPSSGPHIPPPPPPMFGRRPVVHVHNNYGYGSTRGVRTRSTGSSILVTFVAMFIIVVAIALAVGSLSTPRVNASIPPSTVTRERLAGGSFTQDCVRDDIGWIRDDGSTVSKVGSSLRHFWDKTGVQPYVALVPYSRETSTSQGRWDYADWLYEEWVGREDAMLAVYFDAQYDNEDGDWEVVCGRMADSVMDDEALDIMYSLIDRYWFDLSYTVPQAIENAFHDTGDRIMEKTTNGFDVMKVVVIFAIVVAAIIGIIVIMNTRRKHERERAQETVDILQAGQNQQTFGDQEMQDLMDRYDNQ